MKPRRISGGNLIAVCLTAFSIIPDIGIKYATFGFTWTVYRLVVLLSFLFTIIIKGKLYFTRKKLLNKWMAFMAFWSIDGIAFLFIGKYSDFHNGFIEWLSVFNGFITIFVLNNLLRSRQNRRSVIQTIYWILNILLVFGVIESFTGWHWITSAARDIKSGIYEYRSHRFATGLMYNMNDFSAQITCLSCVLVDSRLGKKRVVSLLGVMYINFINDATTCTFAIVVFALFYILILCGGKTSKAYLFRSVFWVLVASMAALLFALGLDFSSRNDFIGATVRQITNAQRSTGSLYRRLLMYKDALTAWLDTGMLGLGPSGFANYFNTHASAANLVNPHAFLLEILVQYGIIVAGCFVYLLAITYKKARKTFDKTSGEFRDQGLMGIAFVFLYVIASFAPSSFIGYSYQWMLIAVVCSQLDFSMEKGGLLYAYICAYWLWLLGPKRRQKLIQE